MTLGGVKRNPTPLPPGNPQGYGLRRCINCGHTGPLVDFKYEWSHKYERKNECNRCHHRIRKTAHKKKRFLEALGEANAQHGPLHLPPDLEQRRQSLGDLVAELHGGRLDATRLSLRTNNPLDALRERVEGRIRAARPWTREDIFKGFERLGFSPGGLFVPADPERARQVERKLRELGAVYDEIEREKEYRAYQIETEHWAAKNIPGSWTWQQALARSKARFRLARYGRRGGKTTYASAEGAALAVIRQKAVVWCAAKTDDAVSRTYGMLADLLEARGYRKNARRWTNADDSRYIELENGSTIYGISLGGELSAVGTGVDLLLLDEAEYATEIDWTRKCLPTLADRLGRALIISSAQTGDETWFNQRVEQAQADGDPNWVAFDAPSWINFYRFPQGRQSQAIRDAEREHARDPAAFLAIYGGKPTGERDRIFYCYKPSVHLHDDVDFNPWQPVICVADPSGGINEYAVLVFQDYGADRLDVIDEHYRSGMTAEEVAQELDGRLWRNWCSVIYLDQGSNPIEIQRWAQAGWPAAPIITENRKGEIIPGKPDLDSSVPIVNNTFRNPLRWRQYERTIMQRVLQDAGYESLDEVPERKRPQLALDLEERLADSSLSGDDLEALRDCSGIRISKERCPNLARELVSYRKQRRRDPAYVDSHLSIRKTADHLCDCLRYMCWMHRRHLWQAGSLGTSYLELDLAGDSGYQGTNWLEAVRMQLLRPRMEGSTYLELA